MNIYIAHSREFDFQKELYEPIKQSPLFKKHVFIFPHEKTEQSFNSKGLFEKGYNLIVAEVSFPSTGLGIELGWADTLSVPVVCIYKKGAKFSSSVKMITNNIFEYSDSEDIVKIISNFC